jgi:hypothetical protein
MQKVEGSSPFIRLPQAHDEAIVRELERYEPWLWYDSGERFCAERIDSLASQGHQRRWREPSSWAAYV